jgi:predicted transcriptional regulator of viral defense system
MTERELLLYMKQLANLDEPVRVASLNDLHVRFSDEDRNSIMSEMSRFASKGIIERLSTGYFINPFIPKNDEMIIFEWAKKLRKYEFFYLSLDYRAFELGMITQSPVTVTFVTTGLTKKYNTQNIKLNLSFVHQEIKNRKGISFDKNRGIYVATADRVIDDAKIHKMEYLLDLIEEEAQR